MLLLIDSIKKECCGIVDVLREKSSDSVQEAMRFLLDEIAICKKLQKDDCDVLPLLRKKLNRELIPGIILPDDSD